MKDAGVSIASGGTDVHRCFVDLRRHALNGKGREDLLRCRVSPSTVTPFRTTRARRW